MDVDVIGCPELVILVVFVIVTGRPDELVVVLIVFVTGLPVDVVECVFTIFSDLPDYELLVVTVSFLPDEVVVVFDVDING